VLITGAPGAGKSTLALSLMALGAELVADDQTELFLEDDNVMARCPATLRGLIEARGLGILTAPPAGPSRVVVTVDLDLPEPDRLPPRRKVTLLGNEVDLVLGRGNDHLPASLLCYLQGTRHA
jgi:HPr kinase/phosphorylase